MNSSIAALQWDEGGVLPTAGLVLQSNPGCGNAMAPMWPRGVDWTLNIPRIVGDLPCGLHTLVIGARARVGSLGKAFHDQQYQLETSQTVLTVKYHPLCGHDRRKTSTEKEATASAWEKHSNRTFAHFCGTFISSTQLPIGYCGHSSL